MSARGGAVLEPGLLWVRGWQGKGCSEGAFDFFLFPGGPESGYEIRSGFVQTAPCAKAATDFDAVDAVNYAESHNSYQCVGPEAARPQINPDLRIIPPQQ